MIVERTMRSTLTKKGRLLDALACVKGPTTTEICQLRRWVLCGSGSLTVGYKRGYRECFERQGRPLGYCRRLVSFAMHGRVVKCFRKALLWESGTCSLPENRSGRNGNTCACVRILSNAWSKARGGQASDTHERVDHAILRSQVSALVKIGR
jgi:hypothetical protein